MDGFNELADLLDREIDRVNPIISNSTSMFRKNVSAHLANGRNGLVSTETNSTLDEITTSCERLAQYLDQLGLRPLDDETQFRQKAAKLAVQRLRGHQAD